MVLERSVPLLQHDLLRRRPDLRGGKLLEVADRVVRLALYADLLAQAVVAVVCAGRGGRILIRKLARLERL